MPLTGGPASSMLPPDIVPAYRDPANAGNAIRPDVRCLGCGALGCITYWGDWCFACNVERMDRIGRNLVQIAEGLKGRGGTHG